MSTIDQATSVQQSQGQPPPPLPAEVKQNLEKSRQKIEKLTKHSQILFW